MHLVITVGKMQVWWAVRRLVLIPWYQYTEICSVFEEETRGALLQIPFFVSKVRKMTFWNVWVQLLDCKTRRYQQGHPVWSLNTNTEDLTSRFSFSLQTGEIQKHEIMEWLLYPCLLQIGTSVWTWRESYATWEWHFSSAGARSVHMDSNLAFWMPREWLALKGTRENSKDSDGYGKELKYSSWKQTGFL